MFLLRYIGSFVLASVVVLAGLGGILEFLEQFEPGDDPFNAQPVEILSELEWIAIAELLGEDPYARKLPELGDAPKIPNFEPGRRERTGFVQIEATVDEMGNVIDTQVVGALPSGVFEEQAQETVRGQSFPLARPGSGDRTVIEVVEFTVPADDDRTE
ncbi:MAG: TonB family protein [Gammaproteobacteria bacterium]